MNKTLSIFAALLMSIYSIGAAAKPQVSKFDCAPVSSKTTLVQITREGGEVSLLDITYIGSAPDAESIKKALKDCLTKASRQFPSKDILANAWLRANPTASKNDDQLLSPFGPLTAYAYTAKSKSISVTKATGFK